MADNEELFWKKRTIRHNSDGWRRHPSVPGWLRDKLVAMEAYYIAECDTDITEAMIMSPIDIPPSNTFYLSMLVEGRGAEPMNLDFGHGRFERPLEPGTLVFLNASVPVKMSGRGPYHILSMLINRPYVKRRLADRFYATEEALVPLYSNAFSDERICDHMTTIMEICRGAFAVYSQQELIDRIVRRLLVKSGAKLSRKVVAEEKLSDVVAKVIRFIELNYGRHLSRTEIAAVAGMHEAHLSRSFQAATGTTLTNYLKLYRLSKSRELMGKLSPEVTISEIAQRCGFGTGPAFHKAFKTAFGMTPREYRDSPHET